VEKQVWQEEARHECIIVRFEGQSVATGAVHQHKDLTQQNNRTESPTSRPNAAGDVQTV
jgi:hypothetical protein